MSLDFDLYGPPGTYECRCECGHKHTREDRVCLYTDTITHNLIDMAAEAGIYDCLWRPDQNAMTKARQIVEPLRAGIERLQSDPERFRAFNPPNHWGSYESMLSFARSVLRACERFPDADVEVSR